MVLRYLLRRLLGKSRAELEDAVTVIYFGIPFTIVTIAIIMDVFTMFGASRIVYHAAEEAATSGATQAAYSTGTAMSGQGFTRGIDQNTATYVTNQDFNANIENSNVGSEVQIVNTSITFPTPDSEQFSATVTYTPNGINGIINMLNNLFNGNAKLRQPITWTITPPPGQVSGQNVGTSS